MLLRVLFVVTSHATLGETDEPTGYSLPMLALPYEVFRAAGIDSDVASPQGGKAPVDPVSTAHELRPYTLLTQQTLLLSTIAQKDYDAYFLVGGVGCLWDFPTHEPLCDLLRSASRQGTLIAAVGHGASALLPLKRSDGEPWLSGKQVTGFSKAEEEVVGRESVVPFVLEDALSQAGAQYCCVTPWQPRVVVDGSLITGQNVASAQGVSEAVRDHLLEVQR